MKIKITVVGISLSLASLCFANPSGENVFYLGAGKSVNGEYGDKGKGAGTLGFLKLRANNDSVFGLDISSEGTSYHNGSPESAASVNLLVGKNFSRSDTGRFDGAFLIGARTKETTCPRSYLGYRCYADTDPDTSYAINFGAALFYTHQSLTAGFRFTGESRQVLLGFRF
jgi:hypothetical protein